MFRYQLPAYLSVAVHPDKAVGIVVPYVCLPLASLSWLVHEVVHGAGHFVCVLLGICHLEELFAELHLHFIYLWPLERVCYRRSNPPLHFFLRIVTSPPVAIHQRSRVSSRHSHRAFILAHILLPDYLSELFLFELLHAFSPYIARLHVFVSEWRVLNRRPEPFRS